MKIRPATMSMPSSPASCRSKFTPASALPAKQNTEIVLLPEDWQWTGQRYGDALVKPGDIIYVHLADAMEGSARRATLEQDSGAQGSLMAIDNTTGDVLAMVGGRDYALSAVQPRHPVRAPDRLQLQALRLHRRH